jgi:exosortase B
MKPVLLPAGLQLPWLVFLAGLLAVAAPTYWGLSQTVWAREEQSHGPVILAVALWLMWRKRHLLLQGTGAVSAGPGLVLLALAAVMYAIGRSQAVVELEALSVVVFCAAALAIAFGATALRVAWFPLFLLLFTVPLPGILVQTLTIPLKMAVSYVAEGILYRLDYPIARTGVILSVGQYQLLVADACAGLTSIFTLEAIGLVYMQLMNYKSRARNIVLAIMVVPCAFLANVIRVIVLVLVTYHFGNDAGQGFVHSFAGILLFAVAMICLIAVDRALSLVLSSEVRGEPPPLARAV